MIHKIINRVNKFFINHVALCQAQKIGDKIMGLADDMKRMGEEMITSYKQRMHENEVLVEEVQNTLEGFRKDHQEMAHNLRDHLNGGESTRYEEFNEMMTGIRKEVLDIKNFSHTLLQGFKEAHNFMSNSLKERFNENEKFRHEEFNEMMNQINQEVQEIKTSTHAFLQEFTDGHNSMANTLKEKLNEDEKFRLEEFNEMMAGIFNVVRDIKTSTHSLLQEFNGEHSSMANSLRDELNNGNLNRIKEFQNTMQTIRNEVKRLNDFTHHLLDDFRNENIQMADSWRNFSQTMANMKNKVEMPQKKEFEKPEKPEKKKPKSKKENKTEGEKEVPVMNESKIQEKQVTVEEKVLEFINAHPEGVKIAEMEEPIGEQRMRLGYVAKRLLVEDKVRKQDNVYYPFDENKN